MTTAAEERVHKLSLTDFALQSNFVRPALGLFSPLSHQLVLGQLIQGMNGTLTSEQVQIQGQGSSRLSDQAIELWLPTMLRVRITVDRIEVAATSTSPSVGIPRVAARTLATVLQSLRLSPVKDLVSNGTTTSWAAHSQPVSAATPVPAIGDYEKIPEVGPLLSRGLVLSYGECPWEGAVRATTIVVEPSTQISGGWFFNFRASWTLDAAEVEDRYNSYFDGLLKALGLRMELQ